MDGGVGDGEAGLLLGVGAGEEAAEERRHAGQEVLVRQDGTVRQPQHQVPGAGCNRLLPPKGSKWKKIKCTAYSSHIPPQCDNLLNNLP